MKQNIDKKKVLLVALISTLLFTIFDYFGHNESAKRGWVNEKFINPYRIVQACVQILLTVACYFFGGWIVVISFTILWWTWCCDWLFYLIGELLGVYGKGYLKSEPFGNVVTWAWWTPVGLLDLMLNGKDSNKNYRILTWQILLFQSLLGIGTVFFINLI